MQTFSDILMSILSGKRYETRVTPMTGGGLKASVATAKKPERLKRKEREQEELNKDNSGIYPYPAGYSPTRRRMDDGGKVILRNKHEKQNS